MLHKMAGAMYKTAIKMRKREKIGKKQCWENGAESKNEELSSFVLNIAAI